jgi:hypothetical protein
MKSWFLAAICSIFFLAPEFGCGGSNMKTHSDNSAHGLQQDRPIIYCWFVEDNGVGRSGYVMFNTRIGRPLRPDEHLYPTLDELRHAIKDREAEAPIVMPKQPDWVPEHWRVRNLSANEAAQLDDSARSRQ